MASTVRSLSNHYETLQVAPTAKDDEIVEAFSSQMRSARLRPDISVSRLAELSVAYETLRDPIKRRAYDISLAVKRVQAASAQPRPASMGASAIDRLNRLADPSPSPPPGQKDASAPGAPMESRVAAFIAASLREPIHNSERETATPAPATEPMRVQEAVAEAPSDFVDQNPSIDSRLSIGRSGATLAAGVIGITILACAAALPERTGDRPKAHAAPTPTLTVALPPAATAQDSLVAPPPATMMAANAPHRFNTTPREAALERQAPSSPSVSADEQQASVASAEQTEAPSPEGSGRESASQSPAVEPAAAADEPAAAPATSAKLPLADATIARTIERIGYGCGRVISTSGVEGAGGVYKITCASGDTYRAAPVHGRYRFRRLGKE